MLSAGKSASSAAMASGERTQSDVESDEEFEEMTSKELCMDYLTQIIIRGLKIQLSRKRLDRVDRILEFEVGTMQIDPNSLLAIIRRIIKEAFERLPIGECSELLRIVFRRCGQGLRLRVRNLVINKAVFYNDHGSLDTLREIFGRRCVDKAVLEEQKKFRSRSALLCASLRGDVAEVERLLAKGSSTQADQERTGFDHLLSEEDDVHPVTAAAEFGHTAVVDALLARLPRPSLPRRRLFLFDEVWRIACRRSNFAMAASVLSAMGTPAVRYEEVSKCLEGTPKFLRDVLSLLRTRFSEAGCKFPSALLKDLLNDAVLSRQRHHVRILLDEIDQDRGLLDEYPLNMRTFLHSRSAAILRDILTQHPEALTNMRHCKPLLVKEVCNWPTGARILVEAGAKIEGNVPSKFVGLLSLSLEDRCRIVVRRNMKLPLSQNVDQLPLPEKVKRRLLYRWRSPQTISIPWSCSLPRQTLITILFFCLFLLFVAFWWISSR